MDKRHFTMTLAEAVAICHPTVTIAEHAHVCRCGQATLTCSRADCTVPNDWSCPSCEDEQRDEFFQSLELTTPRTDQD
jgi:hypothetical protein